MPSGGDFTVGRTSETEHCLRPAVVGRSARRCFLAARSACFDRSVSACCRVSSRVVLDGSRTAFALRHPLRVLRRPCGQMPVLKTGVRYQRTGVDGGIRTRYPRSMSPLLYRMSYITGDTDIPEGIRVRTRNVATARSPRRRPDGSISARHAEASGHVARLERDVVSTAKTLRRQALQIAQAFLCAVASWRFKRCGTS